MGKQEEQRIEAEKRKEGERMQEEKRQETIRQLEGLLEEAHKEVEAVEKRRADTEGLAQALANPAEDATAESIEEELNKAQAAITDLLEAIKAAQTAVNAKRDEIGA